MIARIPHDEYRDVLEAEQRHAEARAVAGPEPSTEGQR